MKITCECGKVVVEGAVVERNNKPKFDMYGKLEGTIIKNESSNPKEWSGLCSECQRKADKEAQKK